MVGRPNVGKSSLVNRLVGEERVVVSDVPGTTRDAIDVRVERAGERFLLVDTAGLRRAGRRTRSAERGSALMTVRALERADVALVVIDAVEGVTDQDARVANLARERGCAVALLVNKWDLVRGRARRRSRGCWTRCAAGFASWETPPCSRSPRRPAPGSAASSSCRSGWPRRSSARSEPPS